jgi:hypothetical protein
VPTKVRRRQKLGTVKNLRRHKHWHRQNIYALTKYICIKQNVGACAEASPYCFGLAKSAVAGFSQTSLMFSFLKMVSSPHAVTKCVVAADRPAFVGGLSPKLYRLICTGPPSRNITNIGVDKILVPAKISLIFTKL